MCVSCVYLVCRCVPGVDLADRDVEAGGDVFHGFVALGDDADALSDGLRCDWVITGHHDNLNNNRKQR